MSLPRLVVKQLDVAMELAQMGIPLEVLRNALFRGEAAFNSATENHPPTAAGTMRWHEMVVALREGLLPLSWRRDNMDNQPLTVHPSGRLAIIVASGDDNTGIDGFKLPSTRSKKGPRTISLVQANARQYDLFASHFKASKSNGMETWLLLTFGSGEQLRAELSLPMSVSGSGKVDGWRTRLLLGGLSTDPHPTLRVNEREELSVIDVVVKRRT